MSLSFDNYRKGDKIRIKYKPCSDYNELGTVISKNNNKTIRVRTNRRTYLFSKPSSIEKVGHILQEDLFEL